MLSYKTLYKDGEFISACALGVASGTWFMFAPDATDKIRDHFADILTVTSIIFGFTLSTLTYYISASAAWRKDEKVNSVASKLVSWHVWSILWQLILIVYVIGLWVLEYAFNLAAVAVATSYGILVFIASYVGFQILNHALTLWWVFERRDRLGS